MRVLVLVLLPLIQSPAPQGNLPDLARKARESVVLLRIFGSSGQEVSVGSGFFVTGELIVSNHHVVEGAARVEAVLADGESLTVLGAVAVDEDHDLVLLKAGSEGHPPLPLSRGRSVEVGERVFVLGSPLGLEGTLSEGIVSALRPEGLETPASRRASTSPMIQISAAISPGSSGSPVMDPRGEVIGVARSQFLYGQNLNFAVPVTYVHSLVERGGDGALELSYGAPTAVSTFEYLRNVGISVAFFALLIWLLRGKRQAGSRLRR